MSMTLFSLLKASWKKEWQIRRKKKHLQLMVSNVRIYRIHRMWVYRSEHRVWDDKKDKAGCLHLALSMASEYCATFLSRLLGLLTIVLFLFLTTHNLHTFAMGTMLPVKQPDKLHLHSMWKNWETENTVTLIMIFSIGLLNMNPVILNSIATLECNSRYIIKYVINLGMK